MTPDEELASCDKTDRAFDAVLGRTLTDATVRLGAIALVLCAVLAALSQFA